MLILAQVLVFSLAWLVIGTLLREARWPALALAAYVIFDGCGQLLSSHAFAEGGGWLDLVLGLGMVSGTVADIGSDLFVNGRIRYLRAWLLLLALGLLEQWLAGRSADPVGARLLAHHLGLLPLLILPQLVLVRPLAREFGAFGVAAFVPFGVYTVFLAIDGYRLQVEPTVLAEAIRAYVQGDLSAELPYVVSTGVFHLTWLSVLLGRQVAKARRLARDDGLTGLLQRGPFEAGLDAALALAARRGSPLSLAFLDVDHFKRVNDSGGHAAGDQVLRRLGDLLRTLMRPGDVVGRWGGEEFVLLMPDTGEAEAASLLAALRQGILAAAIAVPPDCAPLTVSIGYAVSTAGVPDRDTLIGLADQAMYRAKREGRDQVMAASAEGLALAGAAGG